MNLVDTSGWLEYMFEGPNAALFAPSIEDTPNLVVPVICLYEVFKKVLQVADESSALKAIGHMKLAQVIDATEDLALNAAQLSIRHSLPLADAFIYATTLQHSATLWTQDSHFQHLPHVTYIPTS
jgi:toxin FitB